MNKMANSWMSLAGLLVIGSLIVPSIGNFNNDVKIIFGDGRAQIQQNGNLMSLSLDQTSGSGFQSNDQYLYGKLNMQIKLIPGNSAGTVTCFYLHSQGSTWDEIDFEFLGNLSGDPYLVHTNVYTQGKDNREQQFFLWFDPTDDFYTYSILWNPKHIVWYVDGRPIREYKNLESHGVQYPNTQPMWMYSTLWDAEDWATRGGLVKTDWSKAPFIASFRDYTANACIVSSSGSSSCNDNSTKNSWYSQELDTTAQQQLKWVQKNYMVYNYCSDTKRFPQGLPLECNITSNT